MRPALILLLFFILPPQTTLAQLNTAQAYIDSVELLKKKYTGGDGHEMTELLAEGIERMPDSMAMFEEYCR